MPLNVLLITTDQQHAETLGCMGNPAIGTPNIDAIAKEGVVFTQAFTTCSRAELRERLEKWMRE